MNIGEKVLSKEQEEKLEEIEKRWLKEVDDYFEDKEKKETIEDDQKLHPHLDGGASPELLRIQKKYEKQTKEILGE